MPFQQGTVPKAAAGPDGRADPEVGYAVPRASRRLAEDQIGPSGGSTRRDVVRDQFGPSER